MNQVRTTKFAGLAGLLLTVAACSSGAASPPVDAVEEVCVVDFCVSYPVGWDVVEVGEQFISFNHPGGDEVIATVGRVNMEGVVVNSGGQWPQTARTVVDHLWSLLDGGEAELATVGLVANGSFDSWGSISTGPLWHRLIPVTSSVGIGVEMRGPNASWEPHADVFRQSVRVLNTEL